jgi:predicted branched-subunit amino acid permease
VAQPERFALDFAFVAVFTALTVSMWRGKRDIAPWLSAAVLAVVAERWLPGKWYIVIGGIGGALVPAVQTVFQSKGKRRTPSSKQSRRGAMTEDAK